MIPLSATQTRPVSSLSQWESGWIRDSLFMRRCPGGPNNAKYTLTFQLWLQSWSLGQSSLWWEKGCSGNTHIFYRYPTHRVKYTRDEADERSVVPHNTSPEVYIYTLPVESTFLTLDSEPYGTSSPIPFKAPSSSAPPPLLDFLLVLLPLELL